MYGTCISLGPSNYRTHIYTRQKARGLNIVRRRPQLTTPPKKKTQERESKLAKTTMAGHNDVMI